MVGCGVAIGHNCKHTQEKCTNCKGAHIASSPKCPHRREAVLKAKEESRTRREHPKKTRNSTSTGAQPEGADSQDGSGQTEDADIDMEAGPAAEREEGAGAEEQL
jgi:hypothetical protein